MKTAYISALATVLAALAGCTGPKMNLTTVETSQRQWTGVAVSKRNRLFVNFPRWSDDVPVSVAELTTDGVLVPFPDKRWNEWTYALSPEDRFVCVQAVYVDDLDRLWILDPASPSFKGVVPGGAKLVRINPATDEVDAVYRFPPEAAPKDCYLNDVRIDTERGFAYMTDSGLGAIVVLDLESGQSRRVLDEHNSTKSEGIVLTIGGKPWLRPDGSRPEVHADGIALSANGKWLYYQALTGRTLYRIETKWLRDPRAQPWQLAERVEKVAETGPADGLALEPATGRILLTSLELNAIRAYCPASERITTLAQDERIAWPDSIAVGPHGRIYFTTSQIHLGPDPSGPYCLFMLTPPDVAEDR